MPAIRIRDLDFRYPGQSSLVLRGLDLDIEAGSRCILVGANGAGKTTLLHALNGRYMLPPATVEVLGRPAFHDTSLTAERTFLGGTFPLDIDITVDEILARRSCDAARRDRLVRVLGVDTGWHMHRVSDGQRRRVQVLLGLLQPSKVLLLDEVTTDLDVIARADLLSLLREESEAGCAIVYATHIFDGLERWASHLVHLAHGAVRWSGPLSSLPELTAARSAAVPSPLLHVVETWLRADR